MWHDLLGKRFEYGGRGPDSFDCYGLAMELFRRMGKRLPEQYASSTDAAVNHGEIVTGVQALRRLDGPAYGALVLFRVVPPYISHLGVMLDRWQFLHVMQKRAVTLERIDSLYWHDKVAGYYDV